MTTTTLQAASQFTEHDVCLFKEGTHARLSEKLGAHPIAHDGVAGAHFALWAPDAAAVSGIHPIGRAFRKASPAPIPRLRGERDFDCLL